MDGLIDWLFFLFVFFWTRCLQDFPRITTFLPGRTVEEVVRLYYAIQVCLEQLYCCCYHCHNAVVCIGLGQVSDPVRSGVDMYALWWKVDTWWMAHGKLSWCLGPLSWAWQAHCLWTRAAACYVVVSV